MVRENIYENSRVRDFERTRTSQLELVSNSLGLGLGLNFNPTKRAIDWNSTQVVSLT